jgi:uncharacterized membrane protein
MRASADGVRRAFVAALATLVLLEIIWELWLAPVKPGGSWLALKALPLALLWPSIARGRLRATQWALLLLPWYLAEGIVRAWSETGRHALCATVAATMALASIAAGLAWVRTRKRSH